MPGPRGGPVVDDTSEDVCAYGVLRALNSRWVWFVLPRGAQRPHRCRRALSHQLAAIARSVRGTPAPPVASVAVIRGILSPGVIIRIRIHIVYSEGHSLVLGWVARRADVTDAPPRRTPSIRHVNLLYMCT